METKQVIVIRKDLRMRRGKEISQGSHASIAFLTNRLELIGDINFDGDSLFRCELNEAEQAWVRGAFTKVCVRVDSEEALLDVYNRALDARLTAHLITDRGLTEFGGVPTHTCCAIGPDESSKIDAVTGDLILY